MKNLLAPPVFTRHSESAFTRKELVVVIVVAAILTVLCVPVFRSLSIKGRQAQALNNTKGIALTLKLYANDHGGNYPSTILRNGEPTTIPVSDSNTLFAQLYPNYLTTRRIFWLANSPFCSPAPPDEFRAGAAMDTSSYTLKAGENEWAYVLGLTDTSNPNFPLIADGFSNPGSHTYVKDQNQKGGVWKGMKAIVIFVDAHGQVMNVDQNTMTIRGNIGGTVPGDIFTTSNAANGWLTPANAVVNPK